MKVVEYMHFAGTTVGLFLAVPAFIKNYKQRNAKGKANPLNEISYPATFLLAFASFCRLPNVVRGLLSSMRNKDNESIRRFALIVLATFFVAVVFYSTLILMSIYHEEATDKQKRDKHIIQLLTALLTVFLILIVGYFVNGAWTIK